MKPLKRIAVTGAAGQVAYSLLFNIAKGELYGFDQPIALHLIDLKEMQPCLSGIAMELEDCAFPLLKEIHFGSDLDQLFQSVDSAILIGASPRTQGMERKDLLLVNGQIFVEMGRAINRAASRDVKVLVVGNPCNTNCLIAMSHAKDLSPRQFFAMTRLDQNRATYQLSQKAKVNINDVTNVSIWGNHSATQVVDFIHAKIKNHKVNEVITDRHWLENELMEKVQKRGAEIIQLRGKSSAASAAIAIIDAMRSILEPTKTGEWFSMAVYSVGNPYGIDPNLFFSFPCVSRGFGQVQIVENLTIDTFLKEKIAITQKELIEERSLIKHLVSG